MLKTNKMDQRKLLQILRNLTVHKLAIVLIWLILYIVDSKLAEDFWLYVFEMSEEESEWLSGGVAVIYLILAYVTAQLLAENEKLLAAIAICLFLAMSYFSFLGQEAAQELKAQGSPWEFLNDQEVIEEINSTQGYGHWISVGLTMVLFSCAVFIDFLNARADKGIEAAKKSLSLSSLNRWFQSKITQLEGVYQRALTKPTRIAEDKVDSKAGKLQGVISEHQRKVLRLKGQENYQLELLELMNQQRISIKITKRDAHNSRPAWDVTTNAVKSHSILYAMTKDPELLDAFQYANAEVMKKFESLVLTQHNTKYER